ncbi:LacI family DNA-binding transcriptional regulator [Nitrospirillum sp. BR 11164]|uniref:LacI family DNA-binding transcriptional regulator n=1 Tax=Nitrospirillum sp. BR 11164 TaxID=3104324 RepID=UPI002AFE7AC3|nr:LacI family DNA-binding transcriptional regulator [Nitrospirillum sp. BR 11164]MEA1648016.1 LacI family DNA-binding transcriptional regulator [Nitrospirillum sp. BR 11164]
MTKDESGGKRPTLKDVALAAGVSVATASYALNDVGSVGGDTRRHVLEVAARLGYRPNLSAKAMRTGKTSAIGLILPDLTNPFFPALAQNVVHAARESAYSVFVTDTQGSHEAERAAAQALIQRGVDGLIWFPINDEDTLADLTGGLPVLVLDRDNPRHDLIQIDVDSGGRMAAERLIRAGHRRIGVISGPTDVRSSRQRSESSVEVLRRHDALAWHLHNAYSFDLEPAVAAAVADGSATALCVGADLIALGAINTLRQRGLRVPEDVSIIGFDNIPYGALAFPGLSTINIPVEEMGIEAVNTLLRRIAKPAESRRRLVFDVTYVERGTVAPPPAP